MGWVLEIPFLEFPSYVKQLAADFEPVFEQKRQLQQFERLMSAFPVAERHSIAHMNGMFTYHTNQSNLNRFVTQSGWDASELQKIAVDMVNMVEKDGMLAIDDTIVEKTGKEMYGVEWHFDHSKGKSVWGMSIADCVFIGNGIYPVASSIYVRREGRWSADFKTKMELQKENIGTLAAAGLHFSCVLMDSWYLAGELLGYIRSLGKDWIAEAKENRLVRHNGGWVHLSEFAAAHSSLLNTVLTVNGNRYMAHPFTVNMKGMGRVRLVVSLNRHGNFKLLVSNRLDWDERDIIGRYSARWDIEVWHKEGKGQYGLEECRLRSDDGASKYLALSCCADILLEIASLLSPVYASLTHPGRTPDMKRRWIVLEAVGQLISAASGAKTAEVRNIMEGILTPYRSTMKFMRG